MEKKGKKEERRKKGGRKGGTGRKLQSLRLDQMNVALVNLQPHWFRDGQSVQILMLEDKGEKFVG